MNKRDLAFWFIIILVISLIIYLFYFIKTESYACINSPLTYGISKYETAEGEFTCSCSGINTAILIVTKNNISLLNNYDNLNFSIPKN